MKPISAASEGIPDWHGLPSKKEEVSNLFEKPPLNDLPAISGINKADNQRLSNSVIIEHWRNSFMKEPKHKGKTSVADKHEKEDKSIDELADVVVESMREQYHSDLEPFEQYAQKVRSKIHTNMNAFRNRFAKGYHTLLNEIEKQQKSKEHGELPPGTIKP